MKHIIRAIILSLFIVLIVILSYLFFPHKVQHAVFIKSDNSSTTIYLDGTKKNIKISNLNLKENTVFNYTYNFFKIYNVTQLTPLTDRIMVKNTDSFEVEGLGTVKTSPRLNFYKISNNKLIPCESSELIIGKNNVHTYTDSSGKVKTFILSPADFSNMRVGISTNNFSGLYHSKIQLVSSATTKLYSLVEKYSKEIPANTPIEIQYSSGAMKVYIGDAVTIHTSRLYLNGGSIKIENLKRGAPEYIPDYDGTLEFSAIKNGICIVNELNIEDYLKKVVPSEMPNSGGVESLKCQAVAARTYAISDTLAGRYSNLGFYVDDSTKSQVYNNSKPNDMSNTAITSTKGIIITYNDLPIDAKYFSTSCGTGVRYQDVWYNAEGVAENKPYLRTVNFISSINILPENEDAWLKFYKNTTYNTVDTKSPYFRWNVKLSSKALTNTLSKTLLALDKSNSPFLKIAKNGKELANLPSALGSLKDIQVVKRSRGGNVMSIKFVFEHVDVTVSGDSTLSTTLKLNSENTGESIVIERLNSTSLTNPTTLPSKFFSIEKSSDGYIFYGGGYGHGVGMSQYGAMELSKLDWTYNKILEVYYKNAVLKQLHYN